MKKYYVEFTEGFLVVHAINANEATMIAKSVYPKRFICAVVVSCFTFKLSCNKTCKN